MRNRTNKTNIEAVAYPPEFLDCFTETAFKTLRDYLENAGAPADVLELMDSAQLLLRESGELNRAGGKVPHSTNELLTENVADASRCIVALGGMFYAPSGSSIPRAAVPFRWPLSVRV